MSPSDDDMPDPFILDQPINMNQNVNPSPQKQCPLERRKLILCQVILAKNTKNIYIQ